MIAATSTLPERQLDREQRDPSIATIVARAMSTQLDRLLATEDGVRDGRDPEELHRMRVACRRLRTLRRVAGWALAETEVGPLIEEATVRLAALTRASAPARDLDVLLDALRAETTSADELAAVERLVDDWADRRRDARAAAIAGLDGGDLAWLRAPFRVAMERCASDLTLRGPTVRRAAPPLLDRTMRRLRQRARVGPAPTSEQLHDLRIAAKRFRYSCELVLSAFGRTFQEPVAVATALQDALGQIHDDDLATGTLLAELPRLAADPARAGDVAVLTRLIELRRARRDDLCRTAQELWTRLPRRRELARRLRERNL